jgi:hypothetical protein
LEVVSQVEIAPTIGVVHGPVYLDVQLPQPLDFLREIVGVVEAIVGLC